jgi:3-oxoisoapionate kinase
MSERQMSEWLMSERLWISFYGDDFTGSADAMEALSLGGVRCVLFLEPPPPEQLREQFPGLRAVGVAGNSRTMTPAQMDAALPPIFTRLKELDAALFHYKVCSTFDSSPSVGSIGRAIDIGQQVFDSPFVPLLVGAPALKRYCLFGNLFATAGEETFRIDRHPTMSRHPVTPMREGDLRLHLGEQTAKRVGLCDILRLTGAPEEVDANFARVRGEGDEIVLFDVLDDARLAEAGRLIWQSRGDRTLFVAGSSGVEYALAAHWRDSGAINEGNTYPPAVEAEQLIVVSGSCSPVTRAQIEWSLAHGYAGVELDATKLINESSTSDERARVRHAALEALSRGRSVLIYSAQGPDDPRVAETAQAAANCGLSLTEAREMIGAQQGMLLRELLEATKLRRACVAGGDTSSHAIAQLGIFALELKTPMAPGSPLCRAYSHRPLFDGLEIAMKGGQHGQPDYFESIRRGQVGTRSP